MSEVKPLRFTRLAKFDGSFVDIAVAPHINGGKGVELQLSKMLGDTPAYYYLQATPEAREALLVRLEAQRRRESKAAVPAPAAAVKAGK